MKLEKRVPFLAAAFLVACATAQTVPVYRFINLYDGGRLTLGEPLSVPALAVDDSTFALEPGTFGGGGTTRILVRVDERDVTQALVFIYDGSESYDEKVEGYTADLGSPFEVSETAGGRRLHVWQDSSTRFELYRTPGAAVEFWSILRNLE